MNCISITNQLKAIFAIIFITASSCEENTKKVYTSQNPDYSLSEYEEVLSDALHSIATQYRANHRVLSETEFFEQYLLNHIMSQENSTELVDIVNKSSLWYSSLIEENLSRSRNVTDYSNTLDLSSLDLSSSSEALLFDLIGTSYNTPLNDFNIYLEDRLSRFNQSSGGDDVELIMLIASNMKILGKFYEENSDLLGEHENARSGCVRKLAGWAVLGAAAGAGLGCLAGTFLAGPVGCVAGGKLAYVGLGAILGGAAGAVVGYSSGCKSKKGNHSIRTSGRSPWGSVRLPSGRKLQRLY